MLGSQMLRGRDSPFRSIKERNRVDQGTAGERKTCAEPCSRSTWGAKVKRGELTQMTAVGPCDLDGVLPHGNNGYEMEPNIENRTGKAVLRLSPESKGASTDQRGQQAAL